MKESKKTVAEVLLPAAVDTVPASTGSPWTPGKPVAAEKPVILSFEEREREITDGDKKKTIKDILIVFKVSNYTCRTYASVLKGLFQQKFGKDASPFKTKEKGRTFVDKLTIGYAANTGASKDRYPVNMIVAQR